MLRRYIRLRPQNKIVKAIIFFNLLVFIGWQLPEKAAQEFMLENFLVSYRHLEFGHFWTLLTSVFSHNMFFHFFLNMYVLFGFGMALETILGGKRFLIFYLLAGIFASACHVLVCLFFMKNPTLPALGASGALTAVVMLYALIFPKQKILIMGIIPVPALIGTFVFVGLDIWGLMAQTQGGGLPIGHGAHLGGSLFGFLSYFIFSSRAKTHRNI